MLIKRISSKSRILKNVTVNLVKVILCYILVLNYIHDDTRGNGQLIDLTHPFNNNTLYWPGSKSFQLDTFQRGPYGDFSWFEMNNFAAAEHGGTHMDAPSHFAKGKMRLGDIPIERFISTAVVIDITSKSSQNPDAELTVDDLTKWEEIHGKIPDNSTVFMNSGWDQYWPNELLYIGNTNKNLSNLHFPGISPDAAKWLVENRNINAAGVDTTSMDHGPSTLFLTHRTLYEENIIGLENVKNLGLLPPIGAKVYMFPMKIQDGSGGPCRIVAEIDVNNSDRLMSQTWFLILLVIIVVLVF